MSTERIIHLADLSFIQNSLQGVRSDLKVVHDQVDGVGQELSVTRAELATLWQEFKAFVSADLLAKELHLAETRQVKIRQELDTRFGYYGEVRRLATGILQAADISLVRQDTLTTATEEIMLEAAGYWLAPALVALGAWLNDKPDLAGKALAEAIRRDDEKTSLFFALLCRRAQRPEACRTWLDRYFGQQDPLQLDRQTVVLVDALASGVFGPDVRSHCSLRIEGWVDELSQRVGFIDEQRQQWNDALCSKMPTADHGLRYPHLKQYSPTWPALNDMLNGATLHVVIRDYFRAIFDGPIVPAANLLAAVDQLLNKLVSNFDDEELPLRRDERLCQLIIEAAGDRKVASQRYELECKALDENVSFMQLLTNAAMHPETSHSSRATQRYAVSLSRHWIKDAHQDLTASLRAAVPQQVAIGIDGWQGVTGNGDNEAALSESLAQHVEQRKQQALATVKLGFMHWAALVIGIGFVLFGLPSLNFLFLALGAGCLIWFGTTRYQVAQRHKQIEQDFARLKTESLQALAACLAEVVELRRDFARRDSMAPEVGELLDGISPEQYVLAPHDTTRQVMARPVA